MLSNVAVLHLWGCNHPNLAGVASASLHNRTPTFRFRVEDYRVQDSKSFQKLILDVVNEPGTATLKSIRYMRSLHLLQLRLLDPSSHELAQLPPEMERVEPVLEEGFQGYTNIL